MGKKVYNKLVRDKIPEIIAAKGEKAITHNATDTEYEEQLFAKVGEELNEFHENPSPEEMADIMEVLNALASLKGVSLSETERIRQEKVEKRGGFTKRIILESTE